MQLSYSYDMAVARAGMIATTGPKRVQSRVNPAVAVLFGVAVCRGSDPDRDVKLPTTKAEAEACVGIAALSQALESSASGDPQYPVKSSVPVLDKGPIWVTVEEAVTPASKIYIRFANGVADTGLIQKGSFRASPDGVAQVATLTPAAANTTNYGLSLFDAEGKLVKAVQVTSDADGTATEICDALRTALGSITGYTFGGTSTLTITAGVAGEGFSVETTQNIAVAATTPNSQTAARLKGVRYLTSAGAGELALIDVDLGAA